MESWKKNSNTESSGEADMHALIKSGGKVKEFMLRSFNVKFEKRI